MKGYVRETLEIDDGHIHDVRRRFDESTRFLRTWICSQNDECSLECDEKRSISFLFAKGLECVAIMPKGSKPKKSLAVRFKQFQAWRELRVARDLLGRPMGCARRGRSAGRIGSGCAGRHGLLEELYGADAGAACDERASLGDGEETCVMPGAARGAEGQSCGAGGAFRVAGAFAGERPR